MIQVQFPAQGSVTPSQAEALFVELNDEQLALVAGGAFLPVAGWAPVGGWAPAESAPVGGW